MALAVAAVRARQRGQGQAGMRVVWVGVAARRPGGQGPLGAPKRGVKAGVEGAESNEEQGWARDKKWAGRAQMGKQSEWGVHRRYGAQHTRTRFAAARNGVRCITGLGGYT